MLAAPLCVCDVRPKRRGINTLLMLVYASTTSLVGGTPGCGRGSASITFRSARAGTELSTEFWSFRVVTFSIKGAMRLLGILPTKGPRLVQKGQ